MQSLLRPPFYYLIKKLTMQKTVVITGGSQGTGFAAACQLAEKGANVVIVARGEQKLLKGLEQIRVCFSILCVFVFA